MFEIPVRHYFSFQVSKEEYINLLFRGVVNFVNIKGKCNLSKQERISYVNLKFKKYVFQYYGKYFSIFYWKKKIYVAIESFYRVKNKRSNMVSKCGG